MMDFSTALLVLMGVIAAICMLIFYGALFIYDWIDKIIDKRKEGDTYLLETKKFRINFRTNYSFLAIEFGILGGRELVFHFFNKWGRRRLIDIVYLPWPRTYVSK